MPLHDEVQGWTHLANFTWPSIGTYFHPHRDSLHDIHRLHQCQHPLCERDTQREYLLCEREGGATTFGIISNFATLEVEAFIP